MEGTTTVYFDALNTPSNGSISIAVTVPNEFTPTETVDQALNVLRSWGISPSNVQYMNCDGITDEDTAVRDRLKQRSDRVNDQDSLDSLKWCDEAHKELDKIGKKNFTVEQKNAMCVECTLDGKPAKILWAPNKYLESIGDNNFPTVCHYPYGMEVEFSWEAIERILARGGDFKS